MSQQGQDERAHSRAENLLPEEETAGSDDRRAQAEGVLAESDAREAGAAPDSFVEHRTSAEAVEVPSRPELPDDDALPNPPEPPD